RPSVPDHDSRHLSVDFTLSVNNNAPVSDANAREAHKRTLSTINPVVLVGLRSECGEEDRHPLLDRAGISELVKPYVERFAKHHELIAKTDSGPPAVLLCTLLTYGYLHILAVPRAGEITLIDMLPVVMKARDYKDYVSRMRLFTALLTIQKKVTRLTIQTNEVVWPPALLDDEIFSTDTEHRSLAKKSPSQEESDERVSSAGIVSEESNSDNSDFSAQELQDTTETGHRWNSLRSLYPAREMHYALNAMLRVEQWVEDYDPTIVCAMPDESIEESVDTS
ncbi:hypothetical protein EIP86_006365, partial [Pleurotus ostreatoroseus]